MKKIYMGYLRKRWYVYGTLKEATSEIPPQGEIVYEAILKKIGHIDKDNRFIQIKRRKKS